MRRNVEAGTLFDRPALPQGDWAQETGAGCRTGGAGAVRRARLYGLLGGVAAALGMAALADTPLRSGIVAAFFASAGAQEAPTPGAPPAGATAPSDADRAALRYFASEGDTVRLEAELRRLRALYPGWQPPADLLDPDGVDAELQHIYDLVGAQRYAAARRAIDERRRREPQWTAPASLTDLLDVAAARAALRAADEAGRPQEVLRIAEQNERMLTCDDVDSLWRIAAAFAATGRPGRGFDAYAYILDNCDDAAARAATLQKAASNLDAGAVTELFGRADAAGADAGTLADVRLDVARAAVARGGEAQGAAVPLEWLSLLAESARTGERLDDAMLLGFYLYRQGHPSEAAQWFRFALGNGHGAPAAEGYIVALRATGRREDDALAREVAYEWREQTPELMEVYLDAMATLLTADARGARSIADVEQPSVDRFAPVVIHQRDANGAQALGWYAFNTCQFIIAEEWFITSANWVPTEAALYGLALARLRIGDQAGFEDVVAEWGEWFPAVAALESGGRGAPVDPVTGARDDPTDEVGVQSVICDATERRQEAGVRADDARPDNRAITFTEAGSLTAAPVRLVGPRAGPFALVQALPLPDADAAAPRPQPPGPPAAAGADASARADSGAPRPGIDAAGAAPTRAGPGDTVSRRVRQGSATAASRAFDDDVRRIVARGRRASGSAGAGGRASSAQQALAAGRYGRCVSLTDAAIRAGTLTAEAASARGFCLLQLKRPVEAAQAFQLSGLRARAGASSVSDAAYGAALSALAANLTDEAAQHAAEAPLSRGRRTELQTEILTQRALAANGNGHPRQALFYLDQRNRIAPLQKDLMVLEGFAHLDAGNLVAAKRVFDAVNRTGPTTQSMRGAAVVQERLFAPSVRSTF